MAPRVWLITGASSGFGLETTRCALEKGDKVVATLRNPSALASFASGYPESQLLVLKLDVTDKEAIKDTFAKAKATFGRIDVVFNNAGHSLVGEAEATPDDLARNVFEVIFWGAVHVSQEAVRFFREENQPQGGHLIQNSAIGGLIGVPTLGFYIAAKHALEGFTETLWKEMNPAWNIRITSVEPGGFNTEIVTKIHSAPQHPAYAYPGSVTAMIRKSLGEGPKDGEPTARFGIQDTAKGAQKIFELSQLQNPPLRMPLGRDAVQYCRDHISELTRDVDGYAHWSDSLGIDTKY